MAHIRYSADTALAPERVVAAAVDFTDARPEIWPAISRTFYEVYETGPNTALVREGTDMMGGFWAVEHYEWSGLTVRATVQRSSVFKRGTWTLTVAPRPDGGSVVSVDNHRRARGLKGHVLGAILTLIGKKEMTKSLRETLAIVEARDAQKETV